MGEVYRADDLKLGQPVALKFLPESLSSDGASLARLHNEVRIARQVSHPNVCRVYDIGEVEGHHFLCMESSSSPPSPPSPSGPRSRGDRSSGTCSNGGESPFTVR
jgi:serine/threonine protein kinase